MFSFSPMLPIFFEVSRYRLSGKMPGASENTLSLLNSLLSAAQYSAIYPFCITSLYKRIHKSGDDLLTWGEDFPHI